MSHPRSQIPTSIGPGLAPGGVVIHAYGMFDNRLLVEDRLAFGATDIEARADAAAERAVLDSVRGEGIGLVFFDGDSGERRSLEEFGRDAGERS